MRQRYLNTAISVKPPPVAPFSAEKDAAQIALVCTMDDAYTCAVPPYSLQAAA
jgi:hypothetical protein